MSELDNVITELGRSRRELKALLTFYLPRLEGSKLPRVRDDHLARLAELAGEMKRLQVRFVELWEGQKTDSAARRLHDQCDEIDPILDRWLED
jgi:hypothetical protein